MLSEKVDLTENRDFGRSSSIRFIEIPNSNLFQVDVMSSGDYDKVYNWENVFGKKHKSEFYRIFKSYEQYFPHHKDYCVRCGSPIRIPWKVCMDLCDKCQKHYENIVQYSTHKFPWYRVFSNRHRIDDRDILYMK